MVLRRKLFAMVLGLPLLAQGVELWAKTIPEIRQICETGMSWQQSRKVGLGLSTDCIATWDGWHVTYESGDMVRAASGWSQISIKSGLMSAPAEEFTFSPDPEATHVVCQTWTRVGFGGPGAFDDQHEHALNMPISHCAEFNAEVLSNRCLDFSKDYCRPAEPAKEPQQQQKQQASKQSDEESGEMQASQGTEHGPSLAEFMRVDSQCSSRVLDTVTTCGYYH